MNIKTKTITVMVLTLFSLALTACGGGDAPHVNAGKTQQTESTLTEENQAKINERMQIAQFVKSQTGYSQELDNQMRRYKLFNNPLTISYICEVEFDNVVECMTVKGKISAVSSQMTTPQQIVPSPFCGYRVGSAATDERIIKDFECSSFPVESPQLDGSYGTNGDAVFWFDADGNYHEWLGHYKLSTKPFVLHAKPLFTGDETAYTVK